LTNDERRRLAVLGQRVGRRVLTQVAAIVTTETILQSHPQLIATAVHRSRMPLAMGVHRMMGLLPECLGDCRGIGITLNPKRPTSVRAWSSSDVTPRPLAGLLPMAAARP
jgi:hypothetical protein